MHNAKYVLASAIVLALIVSPFALATGEGSPLKGGARNPSSNPSQTYSGETEIVANNATYGTRQSNKGAGGGAIYGCRSTSVSVPCVRSANLNTGQAFQFASNGPLAGQITAVGGDAAKPFTTNATGVATGLNADRVDSLNAADIQSGAVTTAVTTARSFTSFAQVAADGSLIPGANKGVASASHGTAGNYTVVFAADISHCAIVATISDLTNAGSVGESIQPDGKTVLVRTRSGGNSTGTDAVPPTDKPFHIIAQC